MSIMHLCREVLSYTLGKKKDLLFLSTSVTSKIANRVVYKNLCGPKAFLDLGARMPEGNLTHFLSLYTDQRNENPTKKKIVGFGI